MELPTLSKVSDQDDIRKQVENESKKKKSEATDDDDEGKNAHKHVSEVDIENIKNVKDENASSVIASKRKFVHNNHKNVNVQDEDDAPGVWCNHKFSDKIRKERLEIVIQINMVQNECDTSDVNCKQKFSDESGIRKLSLV